MTTKPARDRERRFDPEFAATEADLVAYADFVGIVRRLRRDCPWDREQTHTSVKHLLIEEAYETVAAIDDENWSELKAELGDVLLHVVFHSAIAEENGTFTLSEVVLEETDKLVRRHPHVFGDVDVGDVGEVLRHWEHIKMEEDSERSALDGVPRPLPALLRAQRVQEKAAGVGFEFPDRDGAWEKVEEEIGEFRTLAESDAPVSQKEREFGDVLFALVNYARFVGVNPENALARTNDRFVRRFRHIEERVAQSGRRIIDVDLEEMDRIWDEAKELGY